MSIDDAVEYARAMGLEIEEEVNITDLVAEYARLHRKWGRTRDEAKPVTVMTDKAIFETLFASAHHRRLRGRRLGRPRGRLRLPQ